MADKKKAQQALDQPNRRTFEALLKDFNRFIYPYGRDDDERELEALVDDKRKEVLAASPELKELEDRLAALENERSAKRKSAGAKLDRLRARYRARGLTPAVVKEAQELVEEVFGGTADAGGN